MTRNPIRRNTVLFGDCVEWLKKFDNNTFTAVVTDPPYGLSEQPNMKDVLRHWLRGDDYEHSSSGFMNREWDSFVPGPKIWEEVMRVLKPGGHILSFSGTRTYDLMITAMRLAGAEIRDKIDYYCELQNAMSWTYGQGFPKSLSISRAIDKAARGAPQGGPDSCSLNHGKFKGGCSPENPSGRGFGAGPGSFMIENGVQNATAPVTDTAKQWDGYGTALKPAHEPVAVFGKSDEKGVLPESPKSDAPFFYEAKASTRERNYGCRNMFWLTTDEGTKQIDKEEYIWLAKENSTNKNKEGYVPHRVAHGNCWPTCKPINLMRYLVKMVKMPGDNLILDPFCGSGTTAIACILEGCDFLTIDNDPVAYEIAKTRIHYFQCLGKKGLK